MLVTFEHNVGTGRHGERRGRLLQLTMIWIFFFFQVRLKQLVLTPQPPLSPASIISYFQPGPTVCHDSKSIKALPTQTISTTVDSLACMAQVCYHPLVGDRKQIRVLTVEPGMWDATVACQLDIVDLDGSISYEALSYVWGDNTQPGSILLHGILHPVTPNLESALRYLRYEDRPRVLWVDAVCINQNDSAERTAQVRIMGDIYTMAETTLSWLGEASDDSDVALELIRALGDWTREHQGEIFDDEGDDPPEDGSIQTTTDAIEWLGFPLRNQNWPALWRLLERPYWTRVWIIQELAVRGRLGKASGTFICGKSRVERTQYDYFCSLILLIIQLNNSVRLDTNEMAEPMRSMLVGGHPAGLTMSQVLSACTGGNNQNLDWLLRTTARFKATDSRDKLYALLGLVEDGDIIEPSYTANYNEVVKAYVLSHIERYASLRVLLGNRYREASSGLSWVPDLLDNEFHGGQGLIPAMDNNYFQAAGNRPPIVSIGIGTGSTSITCRGILVGAIRQAIGPLRRGRQFNSSHETLEARSTSLGHYEVLEAIRSYGLGLAASRKDEFWRTLCLDGDWSEIDTIFPAPASFALQSRVALRMESVPAEFMPGSSDGTKFTTFTHSFAQSMTAALSNRTFIVMDNGRLGVGPYLAREGDIVAVLFGAMFCLVLRPVGQQQYRLVGDAYIHGVMHGELVEGLQGRLDGEAFEIV